MCVVYVLCERINSAARAVPWRETHSEDDNEC